MLGDETFCCTILKMCPNFGHGQVGVSVFKILLHVTRPNTVVLGNIPGTQIYQNISRYTEALRVPSFLVLAVEAPFYFANATYLQERLVEPTVPYIVLHFGYISFQVTDYKCMNL